MPDGPIDRAAREILVASDLDGMSIREAGFEAIVEAWDRSGDRR